MDKETDDRLAELAPQLDQAIGPSTTATALALPDIKELCETYRRVRSILEAALPWLERIPRWGKALANALRLLMGVADRLCPENPS